MVRVVLLVGCLVLCGCGSAPSTKNDANNGETVIRQEDNEVSGGLYFHPGNGSVSPFPIDLNTGMPGIPF